MEQTTKIKETFPRYFNPVELKQIKEAIRFMSTACNMEEWNRKRKQAQEILPERIISAVDGLRKWTIKYNKQTKTKVCVGLNIT